MLSRVLLRLDSRSTFERPAHRLAGPWLRRIAEGDGHPVIVIPGYDCDEPTTRPLRSALNGRGHAAVDWGLGKNRGARDDLDQPLLDLVGEDGPPVSIVGVSMGGRFARALGRARPARVRRIITLGSPLQWPMDGNATDLVVAEPDRDLPPCPVPTTSIHSRADQFVDWEDTLLEPGPTHENVRVVGGHCGMVWNPRVIQIVADRLAPKVG